MTPRGRMTPALAAEFAEAGVDRLVLLAPPAEDGAARTIEAGLEAVAGLRLTDTRGTGQVLSPVPCGGGPCCAGGLKSLIASSRLARTPVFAKMALRWSCTVHAEIESAEAISWFVSWRRTASATCVSRLVSP